MTKPVNLTVCVNTEKPCDIVTAKSFDGLARAVKAVSSAKKAFIITDTNVEKLYAKSAADSLTEAGFEIFIGVFNAGEKFKTPETYLSLIEKMSRARLTRKDIVIALGGGVVGDVAGFCAATYLRGISYVQVPTTLLAVVDSSIGGKTGVDLPAGKNLLGAFWNPSLVYFNAETIKTLPADEFKNGIGECIKYAVLLGEKTLDLLERKAPIEELIADCVKYKAGVVERDFFEQGERRLLNLGHTFGHCIEKLSNFEIPHGVAVVKGLIIALELSAKYHGFPSKDIGRIKQLALSFGIDPSNPYSFEELKGYLLSDKKMNPDGTISFVFAKKIGECFYRDTKISDITL